MSDNALADFDRMIDQARTASTEPKEKPAVTKGDALHDFDQILAREREHKETPIKGTTLLQKPSATSQATKVAPKAVAPPAAKPAPVAQAKPVQLTPDQREQVAKKIDEVAANAQKKGISIGEAIIQEAKNIFESAKSAVTAPGRALESGSGGDYMEGKGGPSEEEAVNTAMWFGLRPGAGGKPVSTPKAIAAPKVEPKLDIERVGKVEDQEPTMGKHEEIGVETDKVEPKTGPLPEVGRTNIYGETEPKPRISKKPLVLPEVPEKTEPTLEKPEQRSEQALAESQAREPSGPREGEVTTAKPAAVPGEEEAPGKGEPLTAAQIAALREKGTKGLAQTAAAFNPFGEETIQMGAGPIPGTIGKLPEAIKSSRLIDSINAIFRPYRRGPEAGKTAGIIKAEGAQMARQQVIAMERLKRFLKVISPMPENERFAVIDAIEKGGKQRTPELQAAADEMRSLLEERRKEVQALGTGALNSWIEDYFPHIWKDPKKAATALDAIQQAQGQAMAKRPLKGGAHFLKERTIPTTADGLAHGLEPVTSNPLFLTLLKLREMDKFIFGTRVMEAMKSEGLAKFVKETERAPEGWVKIDDRAARVRQWSEEEKGFVTRGHYYAPEPAARIINNHLSPGLRGNWAYDFVRGTGNLMNMSQLGLSAFHLGFTTFDASVSKVALGVEQLSRGEVFRGTATVAKGLSLTEAVANVWRGDKLLKAYKNPGSGGPLMDKIVDGLVQGGGRISMDQFYDAVSSGSYYRSIQNGALLEEFKAKGIPRNMIEFFPRMVQTISAPIMEVLVPRQKLGVFSDLMQDELRRNPNMTPEELRVKAGKIWESVDNRLGEMVYDNLFWNKTIKDLSLISVRSVGWNLGTVREIGGAAVDTGKVVTDILSGKAPGKNWMTHKMAYVAALPIVTGMYGAIYQYLMTGKGPTELKDYFFPKTGRMTPSGDPERISMPTYVKDIAEYKHAPGTTVMNKLHPLLAEMGQIYRNEDFYGAEIMGEDTNWLVDLAKFQAKQFEPFSFRGYERQREEGAPISKSMQSFFGLNPAPAYMTREPSTQHKIEMRQRKEKIIKRHQEEGDTYSQARRRAEREIREAE